MEPKPFSARASTLPKSPPLAYRVISIGNSGFNLKAGSTRNAIGNFRIIGPGPGNNFLVHSNLHITRNANGEVTVLRFDSKSECK